MGLNSGAVLDAVESKLLKLGVFDRVSMHEPKNSPGTGVTASCWVEDTRVVAKRSGLSATSALLILTIRLETNMLAEPQDGIDRDLLTATDATFNAFIGDLDVGSTVAEVDVHGAYGVPLGARSGYLQRSDGTYRVKVITLPLVINDAWAQVR